MRRLIPLLPLLFACSSSPRTVREYVADGKLFDACVEVKERKVQDERDKKAVLGEALAKHGRVLVLARPLTVAEVTERIGMDPFEKKNAGLWLVRFESDLPRGHDVARPELRVASEGKEGTLSITPQDRGVAAAAVVIPEEPVMPPIPALYEAVPDTDVTLPKPWEDPPEDEAKAKKAVRKKKKVPKKAEVEAWEKAVEGAKKKHNELEAAKVEASEKAAKDALAARAVLVEKHQTLRKSREAAAEKLALLIREAPCSRDDEGFPVLRGQGTCEVVRLVTWSAGGPKPSARLSVLHRVSEGVQTCEAADERTLTSDREGPLDKVLFSAGARSFAEFVGEK